MRSATTLLFSLALALVACDRNPPPPPAAPGTPQKGRYVYRYVDEWMLYFDQPYEEQWTKDGLWIQLADQKLEVGGTFVDPAGDLMENKATFHWYLPDGATIVHEVMSDDRYAAVALLDGHDAESIDERKKATGYVAIGGNDLTIDCYSRDPVDAERLISLVTYARLILDPRYRAQPN